MYLWHNYFMNSGLDPRAIAIQPKREAGVQRYKTVLDGADQLLLEVGLSGFSISLLAERLGFTRRSIYKFFPTTYAILNELTYQYLDQLEELLSNRVTELSELPWDKIIYQMVQEAAAFHNRNPVSRILILGGAVTDESFRVTELTIRRLGKLTTDMLNARGIEPRSHPDVVSLAVDIGTAVFRVSNLYHGEITQDYVDEAAYAMVAYLSKYIDGQPLNGAP
ncbi:TetR/AcrR family transcriptional regulator [Spongiibacter nanhainus]|uniref:TetR/AcrR family transcriptional regulator n=2 Tax=Spongiibacter nanhainus TaxID=2794344 RepID=A0A7T4UST4_9GAMM|nr:TetR/AcrR family transcriptional regulator [Spongiibacter nanhainus]